MRKYGASPSIPDPPSTPLRMPHLRSSSAPTLNDPGFSGSQFVIDFHDIGSFSRPSPPSPRGYTPFLDFQTLPQESLCRVRRHQKNVWKTTFDGGVLTSAVSFLDSRKHPFESPERGARVGGIGDLRRQRLAGDPASRKSQSSGHVDADGCPVASFSRRQSCVATSSGMAG